MSFYPYSKFDSGKSLVEEFKAKFPDEYNRFHNEYKKEVVDCILENKQKNVLFAFNICSIKKDINDDRFFNYHREEIITNLEKELDFENLNIEYDLYKKKCNIIPNNKEMSYKDIMAYDYDEDKNIYMKDFNIMINLVKTIKNIYLWGNAGNGKTTFAYKIASELGLKLYNINSVKNEFSVKGFFDLEGNYNLSLYEEWYKNGGVLLLDECDSYSSNGMLYLNNGIEVNSKYITLENGDTIYKHKDCYVIACANTNGEGKTSDYIGRNAIDKAFMNRFVKKEFKEYAYIHKQILEDELIYQEFKKYFKKEDIEMTCRLCVKIRGLLEVFSVDSIINMINTKEIEL